MKATYTKLRNGNWGIRVEGSARKGDTITVSKKSGETKTEEVSAVVWSGNGITLCAISQHDSRPRYRRDDEDGLRDAYRHGWDGKIGSPSYYSSGAFDEIDC